MEALPDDLLMEILRRLPKKSSCRCKCVSKRWLNLTLASSRNNRAKLTDSGFIFPIFRTNDDAPANFYRMDDKGGLTTEESPFSLRVFPWMLGSCDGFLFYITPERSPLRYRVANPATGLSMALPLPPIFRSATNVREAGFGFALMDSETSHWKLIALYKSTSPGLEIMIFDSQTGAWSTRKHSNHPFCSTPFLLPCLSLYLNGALHWLYRSWLVTLCLNTHTFRLMKLPQTTTLPPRYGLLWESEGRLKYCLIHPKEGLCIWVLDSNWRKTHCVPMDTLELKISASLGHVPDFVTTVMSACAFCEELQIIYIRIGRNLLCYDIAEETMTQVQLPPSEQKQIMQYHYQPFIWCKFNTSISQSRHSGDSG